jgi:GNAT superfamily N-acetyltransferase
MNILKSTDKLIELQELQHQDLEELIHLQPEGWPDIRPFIQFYLNDPFCFPIKIVKNNEIAGIGCAIVHNKVGWLAHIIVRNLFRNQGIGRLITESLVNMLLSKGCETLHLIATDLGAPVYQKVGFETVTNYLFFKNINFENRIVISERVVPFDEKFKEQVAQLDIETAGEERFFHLEPHLPGSFVYLKDGKVEGFFLPALGEGLITASTANAGIELMKFRLKKMDHVAIPSENVAGIEFLHQNNFREFKTAKRMRFGLKRNWKPQNIYNRIGGNLG